MSKLSRTAKVAAKRALKARDSGYTKTTVWFAYESGLVKFPLSRVADSRRKAVWKGFKHSLFVSKFPFY